MLGEDSDAHLDHLRTDRLPHTVVGAGVGNEGVSQLCQTSSAGQLTEEAHIASVVRDACYVAGQDHGFLDLGHCLGEGGCCRDEGGFPAEAQKARSLQHTTELNKEQRRSTLIGDHDHSITTRYLKKQYGKM